MSPTAAAEARAADKRDAIMGAALALFVERGFWGTAVPEIADRAGVGAGTIYRYFESKEALVNAIYRTEKLRFSKAVLDNFPPHANTREQFRTIWMRMAQFVEDNREGFVFLELHHHASYLDEQSLAVETRMTDVIVAVITAAQARRELKQGPARLLVGLVMGAFIGITRNCLGLEASTEAAHGSSAATSPSGRIDWAFAEQCTWEAIRA